MDAQVPDRNVRKGEAAQTGLNIRTGRMAPTGPPGAPTANRVISFRCILQESIFHWLGPLLWQPSFNNYVIGKRMVSQMGRLF